MWNLFKVACVVNIKLFFMDWLCFDYTNQVMQNVTQKFLKSSFAYKKPDTVWKFEYFDELQLPYSSIFFTEISHSFLLINIYKMIFGIFSIAIFRDSLEYPFHHFLLPLTRFISRSNFLKATCYYFPGYHNITSTKCEH